MKRYRNSHSGDSMAGRYPERWVEEVRQRADLVQIVSSYVPLKKRGSKYWGLCPFHGEKTASFSVDPNQQLYYCFGCKAGGTVFRFIMDMEHLSYPEALKYLADLLHMPTPQMEEDPGYQKRQSQKERLLNANREAARYFHQNLFSPSGKQSLDYLKSRGIDDHVIRRFGLGASSDSWDDLLKHLTSLGYTCQELQLAGLIVVKEAEAATENSPARPRRQYDMFRDRAMFPIIDAHGNVLGFGGRILGKGEPKYLNTSDTPVFNKRLGVYAANLLHKERHLDHIILVEGYMDVIALSQFGVHGVVATLGTSLTPEQCQYLKRYAPKVYLAYDGDSAGQHAILRGLDLLREAGLQAFVLDFPDGLDPDEFIRRDGLDAFEKLPVLSPETYRLRRLRDTLDLSTQEGRTAYAKGAGRILKGLEPVELENQIQDLMLKTGFSRDVLLAQIEISPGASPSPMKPPRNAVMPRKEAEQTPILSSRAVHAQEELVSLFATGKLPFDGIVKDEDFSDPFLLSLFQELKDGKKPGAIVEMQTAPGDIERASRLMMTPQAEDVNQMLQMVRQSLQTIRLSRLDEQLASLKSKQKSCQSQEEMDNLTRQIMQVMLERSKLEKNQQSV